MFIRKFYISVTIFVITIISFNLQIVNGWGGGNPPSPGEVSSTVNSLWQASEFSELESYITDIYNNFPDYIPAKLAFIFYEIVYQGHLSDAMQKLNQVKQWIEQNPEGVSDNFTFWFEVIELGLQFEIDMYSQKGISESQLQPNPSAVKAACGERPLDLIKVLEYCDFAPVWYNPNLDNSLKQIGENKEVSTKKTLGIALPIAGTAAVILIAGIVLFFKKKQTRTTE